MPVLNIAGLVCSSLSFVLLLSGALTDFWLVNFGSDLFHMGLWQSCTKNICFKVTASGYLNATRGLIILSSSLLVFGMIFSCLTFVKFHIGRLSACLASAVLESLSAVFLLIGMSIYTSKTASAVLNSSQNYQWSFYLCWGAEVLLILSGICHFLAHRSTPLPGYESV
ncbi:protein NKG7-like isoform X2 [Bufo gargarizans]|uniref:protein NKG7-like isoform X2 n=1 Tax=Bufo gargarizans TaxID=30331 RepID=UPI001CF1EFCE|nr:protein NKG7-like isoform X2 [Bufo gargarizans]XP_044134636.1 protein NKG7-like isoform X2 [Bufo gargarizans]